MSQPDLSFDVRLGHLREWWAVNERRGQPRSEAAKIWDEISLELEFSGKPLAELEAIAWYARQWVETKNPHFIDAAFLCSQTAGIRTPPMLLKLMQDVALVRFTGTAAFGTGKSILDSSIKNEAFRMICCLHIAGAPIALAASKAARYIADKGYGKTYKASTLEREYPAAYRQPQRSLEDALRDAMGNSSEEVRAEWARLAQELPEADDDLAGVAR